MLGLWNFQENKLSLSNPDISMWPRHHVHVVLSTRQPLHMNASRSPLKWRPLACDGVRHQRLDYRSAVDHLTCATCTLD